MSEKEKLINETFSVMERLADLYEISFDEFKEQFKELIDDRDVIRLRKFVRDLENDLDVKEGKKFLVKFLIALTLDSEYGKREKDAIRLMVGENLITKM